ncbi:ATP-binding cassette domain-containing protein [Peribacillus sp. FSL H8-0477]|uniref:ABC transporter ATP-binding protein n=1 Tax=Peribacillus sp. FSL H8-0477 TaxID=2921388 RepID=UPI0030F98697
MYLDIVNIQQMKINEGLITTLVGASGSGKTTLLRLLNRMTTPTSGRITYKGRNLEELDPVEHRRKVSMLSQTPLIFDGTVEDNLQIGLQLTEKKPVSSNQLMAVMETVLLEKTLKTDVQKLSGGEKQRLALARILLLEPEVYLLDEPTSALDEESELLVMDRFFQAVQKTEGSVIMISHSKILADVYSEQQIIIQKSCSVKG